MAHGSALFLGYRLPKPARNVQCLCYNRRDMINDEEIEAKAEEFRLRPLEVQKDYVYGWLLYPILQRPVLARQLILKGGNALRKAYLPDTRLSKDLDFSARTTVPRDV